MNHQIDNGLSKMRGRKRWKAFLFSVQESEGKVESIQELIVGSETLRLKSGWAPEGVTTV